MLSNPPESYFWASKFLKIAIFMKISLLSDDIKIFSLGNDIQNVVRDILKHFKASLHFFPKLLSNPPESQFWASKFLKIANFADFHEKSAFFQKKFISAFKCFKWLIIQILQSLNTFFDYPRTKFWLLHPKLKNFMASLRRLIFHENQQNCDFEKFLGSKMALKKVRKQFSKKK